MKMIGYKTIQGEIEVLTGLHIGGNTAIIEIGGRDNPIIKHPETQEPYIPGSSIKGKMRSLLEWKHNMIDSDPSNKKSYGAVHQWGGKNCGKENCMICSIFGTSADNAVNLGPTRLIVRDAFLSSEYKKRLKENNPFWVPDDVTEVKYENTINRITAMANPRNFERVVAGAKFSLNMTYWVFANDLESNGDEKRFKHILEGLQMIELDALGGAGSRGCGQVSFSLKAKDKTYKPLVSLSPEDFPTKRLDG